MTFKITKDLVDQARRRYSFTDVKNSIRQGSGNVYGALGELVVLEYYKQKGAEVLDYQAADFDFLINGRKVDVKTRVCRAEPLPWFRCNLPAYSVTQKTEFYIFVYVNKQMTQAHLLGGINKADFLRLARFYKSGEPDGDRFRFSCDTYQIILRQLKKI